MKKILFQITSIGLIVLGILYISPVTADAFTVSIKFHHGYDRPRVTQARINQVREIVEPVQTIDPTLIAATQKNLPAVVTINGRKVVSQAQTTTVGDLFGDLPFLKQFGIDPAFFNMQVETPAREQIITGTGVIVSSNGYVVTNNHVVADNSISYTATLQDGTQKDATIIYRDRAHDIAILKIDGTYSSVASLGDSSTLSGGQLIASVGNIYGRVNNSLSVGAVIALNQSITAHSSDTDENNPEDLYGLVQTTAYMVPGYSGGPVIDVHGNVVGINVATSADGGVSFFIPINIVKEDLKNVM